MDYGILGQAVIEIIGKWVGSPDAAIAIFGVICTVFYRLIQVALTKAKTRRQRVILRVLWGIAGKLFGKHVVYANEELDPMADADAIEAKKERLKKENPLLSIDVKKL